MSEAFLWLVPDAFPANPDEVETAVFPTLRAVRAGLRERVAEKGPWWSAG